MLDILIIAPHPDDAEIGMGGTIPLLLAEGQRVGILELTDGEPTPLGSREARRSETEAATRVLGVEWRRQLDLPNRKLEHTLDARWAVAAVIRETRPRVLFAPYWEDAHPDHVAATALVEAARFWAKLTKSDLPGEPHFPRHIFYYFNMHLRVHERPAFVLDVSNHFETKVRAVECYESQFGRERGPNGARLIDDVRARARYWGWTIGVVYGEPFASREPIGLSRLGSLVF
jgi:bacillithiol biosynthesis deacetylase BshB1